MSQLTVELDETLLTRLVVDYLSNQVGSEISVTDVTIEVKSKQNYRSEWEKASFRARLKKSL